MAMSISEQEALSLLAKPKFCEDADPSDWQVLDSPRGTFSLELGLVSGEASDEGSNINQTVQLHFMRAPTTKLIYLKMSIFLQQKKQPKVRVYQLHITTKSYDPDNWHEEAHAHIGDSRHPVPEWREWRKFEDVIEYFCKVTNIEFRPQLEDPEALRLT